MLLFLILTLMLILNSMLILPIIMKTIIIITVRRKIKVSFSFVQAIKTYGEVVVVLHSFST